MSNDRPKGATIPYAKYRDAIDSARQAERELQDDSGARYTLIQYDNCCLIARVMLEGRPGLSCSPAITLYLSGGYPGRQIINWDELSSEQLAKVSEIRREIELWELGKLEEWPNPEKWNR